MSELRSWAGCWEKKEKVSRIITFWISQPSQRNNKIIYARHQFYPLRELRCTKNTIHCNLFFTYIFSALLWLMTLSFQVSDFFLLPSATVLIKPLPDVVFGTDRMHGLTGAATLFQLNEFLLDDGGRCVMIDMCSS